jgi:hypothetical protein
MGNSPESVFDPGEGVVQRGRLARIAAVRFGAAQHLLSLRFGQR